MGIVKMERKISRARGKASRRRTNLKVQSFMPVIKKVDIEELKASFTKQPSKTAGYVTIDGEKYEKELIELAKKHTTGKGEGKLSKDEVNELFTSASDGSRVTETELKTLKYIRTAFEFTDASAILFDEKIASL